MGTQLSTLPFLFRENLSAKKVFLSNQAGAYAFLDSRAQLEDLIDGEYSRIPREMLEELLAKSFLGEQADYSARSNLIASRLATQIQRNVAGPSLFLVVPTLRCDHDCGYCQVSRVPMTRKGYDLDDAHIKKILNVIQHVARENIKIEFQGGEPLLAFPFIKRFVELAEKQFSNLNLSFVICSALGPLSDLVLRWARDHNVVFSVSLDGHEQLHNSNRPSRHFNPHRNVVNGIERIRAELGDDRVSCLATVTRKSLSHPVELVDAYFSLGLESIFLRPLSPFGFAHQKVERIGYSAAEFFEFYKRAFEEILKLNQTRSFIEETALIHLNKIFRHDEPGFTDLQSPAGYLLGAMVFNYDGKIFGSDEARMLWESTRAPELVIGDLAKGPGVRELSHSASLLSDTFVGCTPGCDECAYQPFCGADPMYHLAQQGDHVGNKSISFFCQLERLMFDFLFGLENSGREYREVFKRWLGP